MLTQLCVDIVQQATFLSLKVWQWLEAGVWSLPLSMRVSQYRTLCIGRVE